MRARRDGNDWLRGQWGLIQCNDPSFVWRRTPTPIPTWGMTDDEEEAYYKAAVDGSPEADRISFAYDRGDFDLAFGNMSALTGYKIVTAAKKRGYNPKKSGDFKAWFYDYLGEYLKTAKMVDEDDCFPSREDFAPVDLTIGRDPLPGEDDEIEDR